MKDFEEVKINSGEAIALMKKDAFNKFDEKCNEYDRLKPNYKLEFIFNVGLESLSVHYLVNGELDYWFLFRDLKKPKLRKMLIKYAA